jgi:hypothetical protein
MRAQDDVRRVIQAARVKGSARELFDYRVTSTAEGLCDEPDAHTLVQFERAYQLLALGERTCTRTHRALNPRQRAREAMGVSGSGSFHGRWLRGTGS